MKRLTLLLLILAVLAMSSVSASAEAANNGKPDGMIEYTSSGIHLTGLGLSLKNSGAVRISAGGIYKVRGTSDSARIIVEAPGEDVTLILENCDLSWADDEVIYFKNVSSGHIVLAEGTVNTLRSGTQESLNRAESEASGASLRAACTLSISGSGSLTVYGYINNGIAADDSIDIDSSGALTVYAANDAVKTHGDLNIHDGTFSLTSMNDALQAEGDLNLCGGSFELTAEDDALHIAGNINIAGGIIDISSVDDAVHADNCILINGGLLTISSCREGLEAAGVTISGGRIDINASDDGINVCGNNGTSTPNTENASSDLCINGGILIIQSGGDGIDSNQSVYIDGGTVLISGPAANWDAAIDYGERSQFMISDGTIMAAGYSGMAGTPSSGSTQPYIFYCFDEILPANTEVTLYASDGKIICRYAFANAFNCIILSSPDIGAGNTYFLEAGSIYESIIMTSNSYSNLRFSGEPPAGGGSGEFPRNESFGGMTSSDPSAEIQN